MLCHIYYIAVISFMRILRECLGEAFRLGFRVRGSPGSSAANGSYKCIKWTTATHYVGNWDSRMRRLGRTMKSIHGAMSQALGVGAGCQVPRWQHLAAADLCPLHVRGPTPGLHRKTTKDNPILSLHV